MGPNLTAHLTARGARRPRSTRTAVRRRSGTILAALAGLALLSGCSAQTVDQWSRLGLPKPVNTSADEILGLWIGAWIASLIVGAFVWGLIFWAVIRYRRRSPDEIPTQVRYNLPIEVLYTVAPFVIIFVLFYHTVVTQQEVLQQEADNPEEILVVGQQWSWTFNYLGRDGRDRGAGDAATNDVFSVGTVANRPTLYLPVGEPVRFTLRSPDVIHSFWIPAFYFKLDVLPGRVNTWVTTATKEGTYQGKCAELCGLQHARMLFNVKVVSPAEYERHLQSLRARGNVGVALGSTQHGTIAGKDALTRDATSDENGAGE